ncbi:mannose-6-phosphate receptor binding domain-containing protein [Xylariomycetidae sp. FL0641]|nr:mannose-6-phosphate receptor binding domain-containing protein [Xylariomycetidae sp. FL0641]
MRFSSIAASASPTLLSLLCLAAPSFASDPEKTSTSTACTATSTSGAFFDLRPIIAVKTRSDGSRPSNSKGGPIVDYHARGYDYGSNFTLNICNAVVEPVEDVKGVDENRWANISAYYVSTGDVYSLGSQNGALATRGKELVLQYTGGSPCGKKKSSFLEKRGAVHDGAAYNGPDYERDDDDTDSENSTSVDTTAYADDYTRLKSATIFFSCDKDPASTGALVSYIATDPDECNYVFKVKSTHACAGAEPHKPGSVGPGSVFAIILVIAVLVYLLGGIFYQRTVANARGWKQLPNYSLWASVWSFICDVFVMATSSCARLLPNRRGYHYIAGSPSGRGRSSREDENRLIDQYDEEWED